MDRSCSQAKELYHIKDRLGEIEKRLINSEQISTHLPVITEKLSEINNHVKKLQEDTRYNPLINKLFITLLISIVAFAVGWIANQMGVDLPW